MTTTSRTEQARESVRDKSTGQFGEQHLTDPGTTVLDVEEQWQVDRLVNRYGYGPERIRELVGERGSIAAAEAWLIMNSEVDRHDSRIDTIQDQIDRLKRDLTVESAHAVAALVLREHPEADRITLTATPGVWPGWTVSATDMTCHPVPLAGDDEADEDGDWDQFQTDLDQYLQHIDPHDKMTLSELAVGHTHGLLECDGLNLHDDRTVNAVMLDLSLFGRN